MWNYQESDELYHYGVPGMKWGHRKATVPLVNKNVRKQLNKTSEEKRLDAAKANYKSAKKQYSKDFNKSSTLWGAYGPGNKERHHKTYESAVKANKALNEYKQAKTDLKRARVRDYKNSKKIEDALYKAGDIEMKKAQALYKKTGKNAVSRIINNIKGKSDAVKEYSKQFDKASKIYDKADNQWMKSNELYKKTGVNNFARKRNVNKYR